MKRIALLVGILIPLLVQGLAFGKGGWKGDGVVICDGYFDGGVYPLAIVKDGRGGAIIAWSDSRGSHYTESVYSQRVDSTGQVLWQENGVCLRPDTHFPEKLGAVSDGRGGAIVVWEDCPSFSLPLQVRAQRLDSLGVPRWGSEGIVATTDPYAWEYWPRVVTDGEKGAIVAWVEWCYYGDSSSTRLYAQKVDSLGWLKWGEGVLIGSDVNDYFPEIASDGYIGAFVSWSDKYGSGNQNYVCRSNEEGRILWDITLCNELGWRTPGWVVSDRRGGGVITWTDGRISKWHIYAQRVDSAGYVMWETNGIPVCLADSVQNKPRGVPTGGGGEIAVWKDYRNDRQDLYAQRINGDGKTLWDSNGVCIGTAIDTTEQMYTTFDLVSDNRNGAIIAWKDYRAGNWDIYCQRVDSSGALRWGEAGLGVCTTQETQDWGPVIVDDAGGGAIISWGETGGGGRVRVQRVDSSGNLRWGGIREEPWKEILPREVALEQNFPNPFNSGTHIRYTVPDRDREGRPHRTTLRIYNILGQEVRTLVDKPQKGGYYQVVWDGKDRGGRDVGSGIYFYRLKVKGDGLEVEKTRKMLLLR